MNFKGGPRGNSDHAGGDNPREKSQDLKENTTGERGELGSRGTRINGGRNGSELRPNTLGNAETQRELMAAKLSESRLNNLSESSHFRRKGHSREGVPPRGKDATIVADETTFNPHYSQIPYTRPCLLTKIYVQPPKSVPRGFSGHSRTCTEWRDGSHPTHMLPAEVGEGDAFCPFVSAHTADKCPLWGSICVTFYIFCAFW